MKELIDKTLLIESIEFNGSIIELKERFRNEKDQKFILEWFSENEFKILSKISLGTLISNSNPGLFDGIKGYGKLTELQSGKTKIDLKTKLRVELYFTVIIPILAIIVSLLSGKETPLWSIFVFPFITLWFWSILRYQERILFRKFINYINPK
ncbi:hypothetical protein [Flavobacterium sp. H122]|uniref:hypothetical protein n=1 Tax=Flavobacterium sp. H122 TaxID=2529860 RepID=UPI0010AA761F|nr:hypothetical protein [Flavobacterium sp. H122]